MSPRTTTWTDVIVPSLFEDLRLIGTYREGKVTRNIVKMVERTSRIVKMYERMGLSRSIFTVELALNTRS
jgi:hypothetical protein